ncbi:MAG: hypothetical protein ACXV3S_13055, partial [Kineosporiaceae bacterium]
MSAPCRRAVEIPGLAVVGRDDDEPRPLHRRHQGQRPLDGRRERVPPDGLAGVVVDGHDRGFGQPVDRNQWQEQERRDRQAQRERGRQQAGAQPASAMSSPTRPRPVGHRLRPRRQQHRVHPAEVV